MRATPDVLTQYKAILTRYNAVAVAAGYHFMLTSADSAAGLEKLVKAVAGPILGFAALDPTTYHRGLKTLEEELAVLEAHLAGHTYLVRTIFACKADLRVVRCWSGVSGCRAVDTEPEGFDP